jgi:hypothetical protein
VVFGWRCSCSVPAGSVFRQPNASTGPLNACPRGHRIFALSSGPSVDVIVYRYSTAAGSPHRAAPPESMYAGQSRNITLALISNPPLLGTNLTVADSEDPMARLIRPGMPILAPAC